MSPAKEDKGNYDWVWGCERSGLFSIKSAYALICRVEESKESEKWRTIWNWNGPNRIRFFLWLATKDRLLTNAARQRRGLCQDAKCPRCAANIEDSCHVLRNCPFALETWKLVDGFDTTEAVWRGPYVDWLLFFLKSDVSLLFGIVWHNLWKARNELIFVNKSVDPLSVALWSCRWRETVEVAMTRDTLFLEGQGTRRLVEISWVASLDSWFTLNSDGSVQGRQGKAVAGGLLRDSTGNCVLAYTMNLGVCTITRAELRGALEGIRRAWESGVRKLEIQIDSQAVVAILRETSSEITHSHALEVLEFQEWMGRDWEVKLSRVYRKANHAANHLTSRGHAMPRGSYLVDTMDGELAYFVRYDLMGISEPRLII
ncbi:Putative ribonuclease H protein At1g65750 [Linum perenne]